VSPPSSFLTSSVRSKCSRGREESFIEQVWNYDPELNCRCEIFWGLTLVSFFTLAVSLNFFLKLSIKYLRRAQALKSCREYLEKSLKCQVSGKSLIEITRPKKCALIRQSHDVATLIIMLFSKNLEYTLMRKSLAGHPPVCKHHLKMILIHFKEFY
jgi:hypothetical protein